ncbi:mannan endo-1,6-alpha-mannosidase DFG5 [Favolaschia claudopus]|uniref:Mannan endo-1,6-alpha-mannosidase DFG5 n=1 Tax=Favolaschia claudopus TaxID=2862362 RepID=A0AAW0DXN7_9AGAR
MRGVLSSVLVTLSVLLAVNANPIVVEKRAQCANTLNIAKSVATRLQNHYFNTGNGQYTGGSLWTDANTLEDLHNLMLATGTDEFGAVADQSYIGRMAQDSGTAHWQGVLGGSNDDAGWIVMALWKIADYKSSRGLNAAPYLNSALTIYNIIAGQWDGVCGGGVWWSTAHTYKNAITNELFLLTSATGAINFPNQAPYLANAQKTWTWLKNSGMRNSNGLWNDGLTQDGSCRNNGQTTWTYNQGVIASGLSALYAVTRDASLLTEAEITLDATIRLMSTNNILRESCDNASGPGSCNQDQQIFKGIWTKSVQFYLDRANDASRNAKYSSYLGSQSSGVFHFGTNADNDVGSVWYAPNAGGSVFTPKTSASGLEAHIAAAKYGPC